MARAKIFAALGVAISMPTLKGLASHPSDSLRQPPHRAPNNGSLAHRCVVLRGGLGSDGARIPDIVWTLTSLHVNSWWLHLAAFCVRNTLTSPCVAPVATLMSNPANDLLLITALLLLVVA